MARQLTFTLTRESTDERLGLTLSSTDANDPPFVKRLTGLAAKSGLQVGDVVLSINSRPCANSRVATNLVAGAGVTLQIKVQRDEGREVVAALTRGGRPLGLVMDARNVVVELVPDSAAAESGEVMVGDRILEVNGNPVAPGDNIVSFFPSGEVPIKLRLLRTREAEHHAALQVSYGDAAAPTQAFDTQERALLREAFVDLGGTDSSPLPLSAAYAALVHFKPDAPFEELRALSRRALGGEAPLSFNGFCTLMEHLRAEYTAAHRLFSVLDAAGVGLISATDLSARLAALYEPLGVPKAKQDDEIADMVAAIPRSFEGPISRADFTAAIQT